MFKRPLHVGRQSNKRKIGPVGLYLVCTVSVLQLVVCRKLGPEVVSLENSGTLRSCVLGWRPSGHWKGLPQQGLRKL